MFIKCRSKFNFSCKDICVESQKCVEHCEFENHFHCAYQMCDLIENLCESNNLCKKCCTEKLHGHCSGFPCDEILLFKNTFFCRKCYDKKRNI